MPPEKRFWVRDGQVLRNLSDLPPAQRRTSVEIFRHHVNKEKNDFATWIDEVIGEQALAYELRKHRNKTSVIKTIQAWLWIHRSSPCPSS